MHGEDDDEAWRQIVENFGERAQLDPGEDKSEGPDRGEERRREIRERYDVPEPQPQPQPPAYEQDDQDDDEDWDDPDRFVPPTPPPLPIPEPDRGIAWLGVLGAPLVLLVALIFQIALPSWLGYLMVAWFVGGFIYLVARMEREPRDPWDDGSRL